MSMHFVLETFTSHCKQWPLRSALALLKDGNWVLMQVYIQHKLKGNHFLLLCKELPELCKRKLTCPKELFKFVLNLKYCTLRQTPTTQVYKHRSGNTEEQMQMILQHMKRFSTHTSHEKCKFILYTDFFNLLFWKK